MATTAQIQAVTTSPLAHTAPYETAAISFNEVPLAGKITLRGDAEDKAFADAAAKVLGTALPTDPLSSVAAGDLTIFWIAFDEWMIWTPVDGQLQVMADLKAAFGDTHHALVDVSDYFTTLRLSGPRARDLLAKGCHSDFHPRSFTKGQATGAIFAHANIFVTLSDADTFDIMIRWSFAQYLWDYFVDSAREWAN